MRIKRPLIWVLGGWILGEIVAAGLGWQMTSASGLNLVMESRETLPVTVTGRVSRVAESASGIQITLTENQVLWNETILDTRNLLLREKANTFSPSFSSLCPGTWIRAEGELSAFPDAGNPGEFDQRKYYQQMGVDYRLDTAAWSCLQEVNGAAAFSWRLRNQLKDSIVAVTHSEEAAGVFRALILGDRSGLEQETKDLYEVGGITHILSISALHLTLIGNTLQKILRRLHLPRSAASIICASFLGWYVWLTGGSASSRRAFLMFCVMLLAPFAGRTYDMLSALGLAGLVLLAGQPSLAFQAGFQLSFAAVAGIGILYPLTEKPSETQKKEERGKKRSRVQLMAVRADRALRFSLCIQLATLPVLAWNYHVISPYGLILNLAVIPLMAPLMVCVLMAAIVGLASPAMGGICALGGEGILSLYRRLCEAVSALPGSRIVTGKPYTWQMVLYLIAITVFTIVIMVRREQQKKQKMRELEKIEKKQKVRKDSGPDCRERGVSPRNLPGRNLAALLILFVCGVLFLHRVPPGQLTVTVLDVGQGDSTLIRLPEGGSILCDGGSTSVSQVGSRRIQPYLEYEGISAPDLVFISHGDEDHVNGIEELIREEGWRPGMIVTSAAAAESSRMQALKELSEAAGIPFRQMKTGDRLQCGQAVFTCLYPEAGIQAESNDQSLVLHLEYGSFSGLLTGDASSAAEEQFLPLLASMQVCWLKTGHHGSVSSTSEALLQALQPEAATISCGKNNRYGHPHPDTLKRLSEADVPVWNTAECGAIFLTWDNNRLAVRCCRHGDGD